MNEELTREQIEEMLATVELAEEGYWAELWADMVGDCDPFEEAYRALRSEEHEGIFS